MESLDYWRFATSLTVFQAIILIVGFDPSDAEVAYCENVSLDRKPKGYLAVKAALIEAIKSGEVKPTHYKPITETAYDSTTGDAVGEYALPNSVDLDTTIPVSEIKAFLSRRGVVTGFFFPDGGAAEEFLDPSNPCYAPKLAAAVTGWKAVSSDMSLLKGKTPKQALVKWLRENARQYGLTDEEGKFNDLGIEEVAKVANWNTDGGAARTPSSTNLPPPPVNKKQSKPKRLEDSEDDGIIPF